MILSSRQAPTPADYFMRGLVEAGLDEEDAPYVKSLHIEGNLALVEVLQVTVVNGQVFAKTELDGTPLVELVVLNL